MKHLEVAIIRNPARDAQGRRIKGQRGNTFRVVVRRIDGVGKDGLWNVQVLSRPRINVILPVACNVADEYAELHNARVVTDTDTAAEAYKLGWDLDIDSGMGRGH